MGDERFEKAVRLVGKFLDNMLQEIEDFSKKILQDTEEAVFKIPKPGEPLLHLRFSLTLSMPDTVEFDEEMDRITALFGENSYDEDFDY